MINLQMLIQNNTFNVISSCCPFKKTCSAMSASVFFWHGRHFSTCKSLGSGPVKMSQAFHDPPVYPCIPPLTLVYPGLLLYYSNTSATENGFGYFPLLTFIRRILIMLFDTKTDSLL